MADRMIPLSITPKSGGVTKLFQSLEAAARACEPALQIQVGRTLRLSPLFAGRRLAPGGAEPGGVGTSAYGLGTAARRRSLIRGVATRLPPVGHCLTPELAPRPLRPFIVGSDAAFAPPGDMGSAPPGITAGGFPEDNGVRLPDPPEWRAWEESLFPGRRASRGEGGGASG